MRGRRMYQGQVLREERLPGRIGTRRGLGTDWLFVASLALMFLVGLLVGVNLR